MPSWYGEASSEISGTSRWPSAGILGTPVCQVGLANSWLTPPPPEANPPPFCEGDCGVVPHHFWNIRFSGSKHVVGSVRGPIRSSACFRGGGCTVTHEFAATRVGHVNTASRIIHGQPIDCRGYRIGHSPLVAVRRAVVSGSEYDRLPLRVGLCQNRLLRGHRCGSVSCLTSAIALADDGNGDAIDRVLHRVLKRGGDIIRIHQHDRCPGRHAPRVLKIQISFRQIPRRRSSGGRQRCGTGDGEHRWIIDREGRRRPEIGNVSHDDIRLTHDRNGHPFPGISRGVERVYVINNPKIPRGNVMISCLSGGELSLRNLRDSRLQVEVVQAVNAVHQRRPGQRELRSGSSWRSGFRHSRCSCESASGRLSRQTRHYR